VGNEKRVGEEMKVYSGEKRDKEKWHQEKERDRLGTIRSSGGKSKREKNRVQKSQIPGWMGFDF
jgi:hypothetical protein